MQGAFDFESFQEKVAKQREAEVSEAQKGLATLEVRREDLVSQRSELDVVIADLDRKIADLHKFLGIGDQKEDEEKKTTTPQRDRGVLVVLRQVVGPAFREPQDFDAVAKMVRRIKPTAKESTIRSGLLRLVRDGTLEVSGVRGDRTWRVAPDIDCEPPAPSRDVVTRPHDVVVGDVSDHILDAVSKAKDGIDAKMIAWIMSEVGADENHFESAVRKLESEGKIEVGKSLADDSTVIRLPVDPDSKEGLKRTRVGGNLLFPDMERPPHA